MNSPTLSPSRGAAPPLRAHSAEDTAPTRLAEKALEASPFNFEVCARLIETAQTRGDISRVALLREHAANYCPTTEEFWVNWICEEKEALHEAEAGANPTGNSTAVERRITHLYRRALAAVPTADLWVDYLKFLRQMCMASQIPPAVGALHMRRACETAVRDIGLHTTEGPKVWRFYRNFEQMLLNALLDDAEHRDVTRAAAQAERIRNIFKRQVVLPLAGRQDLLDEYRLFEAELPDDLQAPPEEVEEVERLYEAGSLEWDRRRQLEHDVMVLDDSRLEDIQKLSEAWTAYVKFEKAINIGTPQSAARVSAVYHRACEDLGHVRQDLWQAWARWVILHTSDFNRAAAILNRAVRYHPAHTRLWCMLLSCQGRKRPESPDRVRQTFLRSLQGVQEGDASTMGDRVVSLCVVATDAVMQCVRLAKQRAGAAPATAASETEDAKRETPEDLGDSSATKRAPSPAAPSAPAAPLKASDIAEILRDILGRAETALHDVAATDQQLLRTLGRHRMHVESAVLRDFDATLRTARRLVYTGTGDPRGPWEDAAPENVSTSAADWASAIEALSAVVKGLSEVKKVRRLIRCGERVIKESRSLLLVRWLAFEKVHGDATTLASVQTLVADMGITAPAAPAELQSCSTTPHDEVSESDDQDTASSIILRDPNSDLARTTLDQLRLRREKRRRRLSESESDAGLSDASSDSGSVASYTPLLPHLPPVFKKLKVTPGSFPRDDILAPASRPPRGPETVRPELTAAEIQAIERLTQTTWDGHECHDPAVAPPIPPITSCMSPIRRRRSLSESSTSSISRTSDGPVQSPPLPSATFWDTGCQTASPPESPEDPRVKRARIQREELGEEPPTAAPALPHLAHRGRHHLQRKGSEDVTELLGSTTQSSTMFIKNLDWTVNEKNVKEVLADCPGLLEVRLVRDFRGRSKGFCYVDFETPEAANAAVEKKQGTVLNARPLKIAISAPPQPTYEPKTVFVSNLPPGFLDRGGEEEPFPTREAHLISAIEAAALRSFNEPVRVSELRLPKDEATGQYKGYGYAELPSVEQTAKVLKIPPEELTIPDYPGCFTVAPSVPMKQHRWMLAPENKAMKVEQARRSQIARETPKPQPGTLFVKNLHFKTTEEALKKHFGSVGEVESVYLCRADDGKSKGFGFVKYREERNAFAGLMLNDTTLDGRDIVVSISHRAPTAPKHPPHSKPPEPVSAQPLPGPRPRMGARRREEAPEQEAPATFVESHFQSNAEFRRSLFQQ